MGKKKVLVVDDNSLLSESLIDFLDLNKFVGIAAFDGKQALEVLHVTPDIGLILLDILMPVMDGIQFIEALRTELPDVFANTPIIMLSAIAEHITMPDWAKEKVGKPVRYRQLMKLVEQHCLETTS
ncbi:response regulator [Noviherbaspirillum galbum]|uniref:Response regulator n=1 Tax=Noviherbaspirillum galbum TaxID=2709383 RepID=A0A6B3SS12_9BURK|nr:response regulator [Noviherbaspirillum galbum]NEX63441.1 response regulator [Noviherbaspirillum galbum]